MQITNIGVNKTYLECFASFQATQIAAAFMLLLALAAFAVALTFKLVRTPCHVYSVEGSTEAT